MTEKPNWNRLAALEFAGRVLTGRKDIHAGEAQAHADWALQWLGGDLPNSERPPGREDPEKREAFRRAYTPPGVEKKVQGLNTAASRVRADLSLQNWLNRHPEGAGGPVVLPGPPDYQVTPEAPPRNVPVEGDGSTTPPIYRFYRECVDPDCKNVYYWREDTRNTTNRWSLWVGTPAEPEDGIDRWVAQRIYDDPANGHRPPPERMTRLTAEQLAELDIPVESRYDTEE